MNYFQFSVPGQPVSWNAAFKTRMGQRGLFKTKEAEVYQDTIAWLAKIAKKNFDFVPEGRLIVTYGFYLKRDMDCDNVLKLMNDAIAVALNHNDKHFMPVVLYKATGVVDPHTEIAVYDASAFSVKVVPNE